MWQVFKLEKLDLNQDVQGIKSPRKQSNKLFPAEFCKENEKVWKKLQHVAFERLLVNNCDFSELDLERTGIGPDT